MKMVVMDDDVDQSSMELQVPSHSCLHCSLLIVPQYQAEQKMLLHMVLLFSSNTEKTLYSFGLCSADLLNTRNARNKVNLKKMCQRDLVSSRKEHS